MRALLVAVLLIQALIAQAGVAGMFCMHRAAGDGHSSDDTTLVATHAVHPPIAQADDNDGASSGHHCACNLAGHCTASAISAVAPLSGVTSYPAEHAIPRYTESAARGFETPPYRPPSTPV